MQSRPSGMDSSSSLSRTALGPFSHPPERHEKLIQKLLQADAKVVTLRPVIDEKSKTIAEAQRENFKSSLAQELARVKLLNNKQHRKDKGTDASAHRALAEYRAKSVLATLSKAKPWLASSDDRGVSLYNCREAYRARAAETADLLLIQRDDDDASLNRTGSPVITPYEPPSPPPPDDRGRRVFQTGGPPPSFSTRRSSFASSSNLSASPTRPPSAASSLPSGSPALSHTATPSRPRSGFSASFSSSRPRTAASVVSSRAPFGGWSSVPTRPLSSKQGCISAEQTVGMEILQRRRCEVLGRSMWRLGKNQRSVIAAKGKMEGGNSDFARELKRSNESKERNLAMLEGLFRWMYLLDEQCSAAFEGCARGTWEQINKIAGAHNELVSLKCDKCTQHILEVCEGKLGWKHPDPPSAVAADHPCRYDFLLDWVVAENRGRTSLYSRWDFMHRAPLFFNVPAEQFLHSLSKQWRDAADGRKAACVGPNDILEWTARIVSWLFDSFPLLPTQELDHELTDRMVIKMFDAFPSAPSKAKSLAMAVFLDTCGFGALMPQEMRDTLLQNVRSEDSSLSNETQSPTSLSVRSFRSSSVVDSEANDATTTLGASILSKKCDEVREAKQECKDELIQLYKSAISAINKEEAVSKAIFANVLQMHSWSKENESLFSGTDVGVVLNKVMLTFVAATKASRSTLVVGMSKLNKKLAFLKQQHQQLKIKLQLAKAEAAQKLADNSDSPQLASMSPPFTSRQSEFTDIPRSVGTSPSITSRRKEKRLSISQDDYGMMQDLDLSLGRSETFSPTSFREGAYAKFMLMERRDSNSGTASPSQGRGRRMSQVNLRDFASRAATDSPELFEIPGFEASAPSPPPIEEDSRQRRTTMDLFKAIGNATLTTGSGGLEALIDTYQSKKLQGTYLHMVDDFQEDKEHLSVMFRKTVIEARKKLLSNGARTSSTFETKISAEDVVKLMNDLGEPVKLTQVVAFLQPAGFNAAMGPTVTFDDFFGWWCYYHNKISEAECNGAQTSRSQ